MDQSQERKACLKLAQLHRAIRDQCKDYTIEKILAKEGDINYAFPGDGPYKISHSGYISYIGYTALHFACEWRNTALVKRLLNNGADFTKKSADGKTALHVLIETQSILNKSLDWLLDSVLGAHIERNNFSNPCNKDGLSHFHIACMTNNLRSVQFFLDNGISVDECTNTDSKSSPGYAPLHFAAKLTKTEVAEILLAYGANMHKTDSHGKTPLHILIEQKMEMHDQLARAKSEKSDCCSNLQSLLKENDKIINMILENTSTDNDGFDHIGLSNFHVAIMLQDTSIAEHLADQGIDLNHCVNEDSRLWPKFTALHFAAHISISAVEMLMKKGANMELKDTKGFTPLDICIERFSIQDICSIINLNENWKQIILSDGETKLVSLISAMVDPDCIKKLMKFPTKDINISIPMESPLWPGYTPLHLAVLFAERPKLTRRKFFFPNKKEEEIGFQIIRFCLGQGADASIQDSRGRTPLHLAFRLNKIPVVDEIFRHCRRIKNVSDEENLSHLHIACANSSKEENLKKCTFRNADTNAVYRGTSPINTVRPGSTPLHVSLIAPEPFDGFEYPIMTLMKRGADVNIKDAYGLTPVHWLLGRYHFYPAKLVTKLLERVSNDCVAEECNISYLHVACHFGNEAVVERLLENGADVNLAISYTRKSDDDPLSFLSRYNKCAPLHFSSIMYERIAELLVEHGADVFAEMAKGVIPLHNSRLFRGFIAKFWNDENLQNHVEREFGWTKLHVACRYPPAVPGKIQDIIEAECSRTNVNARVFSSSPLWQGHTPLHLLVYRLVHYDAFRETYPLIKMLLEKGADVTVLDDDQNSPLHLMFRGSADIQDYVHSALLMKSHRNFKVNPVNTNGISHFHVACILNDVDAVKGFLSHGVDANKPTDFSNNCYLGRTPLHFASDLSVIDLLVNHGADIHVEDANGCTALHKAISREHFDESVIARLIESGAEINRPNFRGITPLEKAIEWNELTIDNFQFLLKHGFSVNSCNPITGISYISLVCRKYYKDKNVKDLIIEMMMNECSTNILGRTTLHHSVTWRGKKDCIVFIQKLLKSGHDVDEQDDEGKTALRLAVEFENVVAVRELLMSGADINVLDSNGCSVLSCAVARTSKSVMSELLITHAWQLVWLKLDLNQLDRNALSTVSSSTYDYGRSWFLEKVEKSKEIEIGVRALRLCDFLSETSAVMIYPTLNQLERQRVDKFFELINSDITVDGILKLQYRKAVKRLEYIGLATNSLRSLLGFDLPDLCAENIFLYLPNPSLKNLIQAEMEIEDVRMDVNC